MELTCAEPIRGHLGGALWHKPVRLSDRFALLAADTDRHLPLCSSSRTASVLFAAKYLELLRLKLIGALVLHAVGEFGHVLGIRV